MAQDAIGVIFDMDGVMVLSEEAHWESWRVTAARRGITLTHRQFLACFGQVNADCIPAMFGEDTPADEVEAIADEKERAYRDIVRDEVPLAPGLTELIDGLRAAGARFAVGSSAPPENVDLILDQGGLRADFPVTVDSTRVKRGKPAPDVFLLCAEALDVPPERCIVIEDAPHGIQAAVAAGMRAVAVATTNDPEALYGAGAHVLAPDLASLDLEQVLGPLGAADPA